MYQRFGKDWPLLDWSEDAKLQLFLQETFGKKFEVEDNNGWLVGKKWMNVTVAMWKEDIELGLLRRSELYEDESLPNWWLDSIFGVK